jgi:hypothetical protein
VDQRKHFWKNVSFAFATLLLWAAVRVLYVRVFHGQNSGFKSFDVLFIFLPPIGAFFLNWYWMREQRIDTMVKWSISWSGIDLAIFIIAIFFMGQPLHNWIVTMSQ